MGIVENPPRIMGGENDMYLFGNVLISVILGNPPKIYPIILNLNISLANELGVAVSGIFLDAYEDHVFNRINTVLAKCSDNRYNPVHGHGKVVTFATSVERGERFLIALEILGSQVEELVASFGPRGKFVFERAIYHFQLNLLDEFEAFVNQITFFNHQFA